MTPNFDFDTAAMVSHVIKEAVAANVSEIKVQLSEHVVIAAAFPPKIPVPQGKREQVTDDDKDLAYQSS